jgi:quercetin dioxygenase-like cupin family protein
VPLPDGFRIIRKEGDVPVSEVEAEARLHQEGYASFRWHDVPGATYPRHRHAEDECLWILSGVLEIELTDPPAQKIKLHPGDRIYLPARTPHRAAAAGGEESNGVTYLVGQKSEAGAH